MLPGMTDPKTNAAQAGLPEDAGNDLSERAGHYDESPSGQTDTPIGGSGADQGQISGTRAPFRV